MGDEGLGWLGGFGRCYGCVMLVLVWQVTSGKNLRRTDSMCAKSRITEAESGKLTGWFIIFQQNMESAFVLCKVKMHYKIQMSELGI